MDCHGDKFDAEVLNTGYDSSDYRGSLYSTSAIQMTYTEKVFGRILVTVVKVTMVMQPMITSRVTLRRKRKVTGFFKVK